MVWQSGLCDGHYALRILDHHTHQSVSASWRSSGNSLLRSTSVFAAQECQGKSEERLLFVFQKMERSRWRGLVAWGLFICLIDLSNQKKKKKK